MSKHTPWSQTDAEKWAKEYASVAFEVASVEPYANTIGRVSYYSFLAGLAKAAEMIEASPNIYCSKPDGVSELWTHNKCDGHDTHSGKLVGVKPIDKEGSEG